MPPVLDRVRYWNEGASNKNKNDILLLGVPSKKMSSMKQKDNNMYGPIKRTYYSPPYQSHFSSTLHHQQQQQQQYVKNNIFSIFRSHWCFSIDKLFLHFHCIRHMTAPAAVDATAEACYRLQSHVNTSLSASSTSASRVDNVEQCLYRATTGKLNQPYEAFETNCDADNDQATVNRTVSSNHSTSGSITR